jgi:hypothetical protein
MATVFWAPRAQQFLGVISCGFPGSSDCYYSYRCRRHFKFRILDIILKGIDATSIGFHRIAKIWMDGSGGNVPLFVRNPNI